MLSTLDLYLCSLLERKDLWRREAEARQQSQPDPTMPPGHTRMPEKQRLETLNNLLQSEYPSKRGWMGGLPGDHASLPSTHFLGTCSPDPAAA